MTIDKSIDNTAVTVQRLVDLALTTGPILPDEDTPPSAGLRDGLAIIREYLAHGERKVAFEHLVYMLLELDLAIPASLQIVIAEVGTTLGVPRARWAGVRIAG